MHVGPKVIAQRDNTLAKIIEKMTAAEYSANYQNLQKDFEENKMKLNSLLLMIKNQEIAASIKNYAEINNLQRNLQKKQEHMRRMEYKIKESSQNMTNIIITLNLLIFPIITIAVIVLIAFLLRHRNKVQAERIINE